MRRRQSSIFFFRASIRAKIILAIFALVIFVVVSRTIGSAPQDNNEGRRFIHLRGGGSNSGSNNNLVWVHSDSQPFVSESGNYY